MSVERAYRRKRKMDWFFWFFSARCVSRWANGLWRIGDPMSCMSPADVCIAISLVVVGMLLLAKIILK